MRDLIFVIWLVIVALLLVSALVEGVVRSRRWLMFGVEEVCGLWRERRHFADVIREACQTFIANRVRRRVERARRDEMLVEQLDRVSPVKERRQVRG